MKDVSNILKNIKEFLESQDSMEYGKISISLTKHQGEYSKIEKSVEEVIKEKLLDLM
jgi:hypothetical protein